MEIEVGVGRVDLRWRNPTNYLRQVIKVNMEREKSSVIACAHVGLPLKNTATKCLRRFENNVAWHPEGDPGKRTLGKKLRKFK